MNHAPSPRLNRFRLFAGLALSLLFWAVIALAPAQAQTQSLRDSFDGLGVNTPLQAEQAFRLTATPLPGGGLALEWQIEDGYYLYRAYLAVATPDGAALALDTPAGISKDDPNFGPSEIYYRAVTARLAAVDGPVNVTWQGCQEDGLCYPPITRAVTPDGAVLAKAEMADGSGLDLASGSDGMVAGIATRGGPLLVLASFLGFGLLLAFTPCVFPMFPILAGMLARQGESLTPGRGALLSGAYVLPMAAAFGLLGMAAAWSGQNLQLALQSPLALGIVTSVFVLLALSMFGAFEMQLPAAMTARLSRIGGGRRGSLGGAAMLGFSDQPFRQIMDNFGKGWS
ncbi:MAG: cytochrome c biogenesis protein transmembrane region [uncultured bacterium]|nr:MAG: cytochrome c biogenesis protein transmembrane region [uncultured bacterium]